MSEWTEKRLGEIVEVVNGYAFKSKDFKSFCFENDLPVLKIKNVANGDVNLNEVQYHTNDTKFGKFTAKKNDLLIALTGNHPEAQTQVVGSVSKLKMDIVALINQRVAKIIIKENLADKNFIYYSFKLPEISFKLASKSSGSANQANISKSDIENLVFKVPPLPEQQAIASVLSSLDDKIDLLHRQNKTLEAMAETLFRQWFIEEAKDDWEIKKLADIANIFIGRTPPRKESHWFSTSANDVKWISIKDMASDGCFVNKTSEFLNSNTISNFTIPIIPKDTVVLSFKMTVGRVKITNEDMVSNEAIAQFQIKDTKFSKEWLYCYLKQFNYDVLGTTSSIVTSINTALIKGIEIPAPDDKLIKKFNENSFSIFEKIRFNQIQIQILDNLRDTLLPKLMSGEIRVKVL